MELPGAFFMCERRKGQANPRWLAKEKPVEVGAN
jgi:hypothetical protein